MRQHIRIKSKVHFDLVKDALMRSGIEEKNANFIKGDSSLSFPPYITIEDKKWDWDSSFAIINSGQITTDDLFPFDYVSCSYERSECLTKVLDPKTKLDYGKFIFNNDTPYTIEIKIKN